MNWKFLIAAWTAMLMLGPAGAAWPAGVPGHGFILGISQGSPEAVPVMEELGLGWGRVGLEWRKVMPEITPPLLRLGDVIANDELVDALIDRTDWTLIDADLRLRLDHGITPIPIIGSGWHNAYALYQGQDAYPDRIGQDAYLAYMYLYVRAAVERYDGDGHKDATGIVIKFWQTENELNQAALTAAWGWRKPEWVAGLSSAWADWRFVTRLLEVLYQAVHDADPQALTTMNFHTDIHPALNRRFGQPDWVQAVGEWQDLMDVIGVDAYPNYYRADPVEAEVVGERVRMIKEIAGGKPTLLVEIDYPFGPAERGYSAEKQADFLLRSFRAARAAGVDGYMKFRVVDDAPAPIEITARDLKNLARVVPLYEQGKIGRLLLWALPRAGYVQSHFLDVLKSVEEHWGVFEDGERTPTYYVLKGIVAEVERGGKPKAKGKR